ncbi:GGDEF domain-containing protein [Actinophytocola sp.]|uniref:GGDEF domain-containing protein n=1 Tax=Actinophytocola sp. TaxID=1872138 RepID=UPI00389B27AE
MGLFGGFAAATEALARSPRAGPDADIAQSMLVAERLRARIAELSVPTIDPLDEVADVTGQTASIGVAGKPWHGTVLDVLLHAADVAVRAAKASGGNAVRAAGGRGDR